MDQLIQTSNFIHDDEEQYNSSIQAMRKLTSEYQRDENRGSAQGFRSSLNTFLTKLAKDGIPVYQTKGWDQAHKLYKEILQIYRLFSGKECLSDNDAHTDYFKFVVKALQDGHTMLHMQAVYDCIQDRNFELKEYIQKLDRQSLQPLISAVCRGVKVEEKVEGKVFGDMFQKLMRQLLRDTLTKDQSKDFMPELLDFAVYLSLDCKHLQEDVYKRLAETGKIIIDLLDDPFTNTQDIQKLRTYMKRCGETFKEPGFPPTAMAASKTKDFTDNLITKLGKRGLVDEIYDSVFDLLLDVGKCPSDDKEYILKLFDYVYGYFRKLPKDALKKNGDLFLKMAKRYSSTIEELDMFFLQNGKFAYTVLDDGLQKLYADNKEVVRQWVELLVPLFKRATYDTMRAAGTVFRYDKAVKWKEHPQVARQVFDIICAFEPPSSDGLDEKEKKQHHEFLDYFARSVKNFFEGLKKSKMLKLYSREMLPISMKLMETGDKDLIELAEDVAERIELNPKEDKEVMMATMKRLHTLLKREDYLWNESWPLQRAANDLIDSCLEPFKDGKVFMDEEFEVLVSMCLTCLEHDCIHPETGQFPSAYFSVYLTLMKQLNKWLGALNKVNLAAPLVPRLVKCFDLSDPSVTQLCSVYLYLFAQSPSGRKSVSPYLEQLINIYLDQEDSQLLMTICEAYPSNPKALKSNFRALMDLMDESGEPQVIMYLAQLFQKVAKIQAELFTDEDIEMIMNKAKDNTSSQNLLLEIVKELCKRRPESMIPHIDLLMDKTLWQPYMLYGILDMQSTLVLYKKDIAPRVIDDMIASVKTTQDKSMLLTYFNFMRTICFKYPDLMKPRRAEIDALQLSDIDAVNMKQMVLDMIDGKTSDEMRNQLEKQQQDLQSLVGRVDETEEAITDLRDEVGRQGEQLDNVKNETSEQGQRLDQVEQTVDETVAKVEEIDQKTLSHAPFWARDVSKLLNPVSDHDWRLLSSRLGYSNDDIRGWAQQADPCMAMLNEWYATRKTSEATFAVLTQLQEMNRLDTAVIVENAMKNAEAVVEDEDFDYPSPPPVFISYEWSHQPEVKLLKQHLDMAGYDCWLDIGQMGGGDKLFQKIDNGIRAAKLVISCVSNKYPKSPNCNREVNLAVNLNKPIIPLLLEKCTWPPPGSMGPIFSEYLFIRFFQRQGEETEDQRYWAKEKFQELLMQLNMFGLQPEEGKVTPEYKNWWVPVVQEIKIDKSKTKNGGQVKDSSASEAETKAADSPDVFISYQWGKQKNIIKLYERLTSLGFSCWLDIKQMGGGDSLMDKIDRGIRGCKVVISCVTQKYALSANCRREVSLASAVDKPLVPLLLEEMAWPPAGPMSMVMTGLLYIDFSKDEAVQMTWDGPSFQNLLKSIQQYVPQQSSKKTTASYYEKFYKTTAKPENAAPRQTTAGKGKDVSTGKQQQKPGITLGKASSVKNTQPSQTVSSRTTQSSPAASSAQRSFVNRPHGTPSPSSSSSSSTTANRAQPKERSSQQMNAAKKSSMTKVSSVNRFLSPIKSSPKPSPAQQARAEPPDLAVSSRRLLKPLSTGQTKAEPAAQAEIPSKAPGSQQSSTRGAATQRPSRLPPMHQSKSTNGKTVSERGRQQNNSQGAHNTVSQDRNRQR